MITRRFVSLTAAALLASGSLLAQNLLTYRPNGGAGVPARMFEFPVLSRAWDGTGPGLVPGACAGRARPFVSPPLGACAVKAHAGLVFSTNGLNSIQRTQYPRIGSSTGVLIPSLPFPAGVTQVTGLAADPVANTLFLTDGTMIYEVDPTAGMAVLIAFPASPLNILAGLDYDPAQPTLIFAVSTAGEVATYNRGGGLVTVASPTYAWPGAEAVGLALDKSNATGGDAYVVHSNGEVYNHFTGMLHRTVPGNQVGMAYLASPVQLPSAGACSGVAPEVSTTELAVAGHAGFGLEIDSLPAGTAFVVWLVELLPPGAGPALLTSTATPCSGPLWPAIGGPTLFTWAGGAPSATQPLGLPPAFAGWSLIVQPFVPCASSACGYVFPNAMQIEISRG